MILPYISKETLIEQTKPMFQNALTVQPDEVWELVQVIFGREVFVWHMLTQAELTALRRGLFRILLTADDF